jgi:hypothetical protein
MSIGFSRVAEHIGFRDLPVMQMISFLSDANVIHSLIPFVHQLMHARVLDLL